MKFLVDINSEAKSKDVHDVLTNNNQRFLCDVTVAELPVIPEVKVVETGILMSPAEIYGKEVVELKYLHNGTVRWLYESNTGIGQRLIVDESVFPRKFYRDIQRTWDFASIPRNSIVEIVDFYENMSWGRFTGNGVDAGKEHWIGNNHIKSIRIIELPKDGE